MYPKNAYDSQLAFSSALAPHRYRTHSAQRDRVTRRRDGVAVGGIPQGSRDIPWDGSLSATSASRRAFAGGGRDVDSVFDTVSPSSSSLSCLSTTGGFTASSLCNRDGTTQTRHRWRLGQHARSVRSDPMARLDDHVTSTIRLRTLRRAMTIIPQDSVMF